MTFATPRGCMANSASRWVCPKSPVNVILPRIVMSGSWVAVGAPTSLAVDLAKRAGLAVYGFAKPERVVRYS